jgi:hypothetical protein
MGEQTGIKAVHTLLDIRKRARRFNSKKVYKTFKLGIVEIAAFCGILFCIFSLCVAVLCVFLIRLK